MTPLHFAAKGNFASLVSFLLKRKGNPLAQNRAGKLPSELATDDAITAELREAEEAASAVRRGPGAAGEAVVHVEHEEEEVRVPEDAGPGRSEGTAAAEGERGSVTPGAGEGAGEGADAGTGALFRKRKRGIQGGAGAPEGKRLLVPPGARVQPPG